MPREAVRQRQEAVRRAPCHIPAQSVSSARFLQVLILRRETTRQLNTYTIEQFWRTRLRDAHRVEAPLVPGWRYVDAGLSTFKEAPLTLSNSLTDVPDPESAPLLLVSAPGAVGKTTLAKQLAFRTDSIYLNLAETGPVGDNTLSGWLLQSQLAPYWQEGSIALLIDGLDEARLRVTQEAFEAFLSDVAELATTRSIPTVLFGRTGAIEDTWLVLADQNMEAPVFEIGYYVLPDAIAFAQDIIRHQCGSDAHLGVRLTATELLVSNLREQTEQDGDRFAGYAPVLSAVAERVAADSNPGALVSEIDSGSTSVTLQSVVDAILNREQRKLSSLTFEDATLGNELYVPREQLDHLVAKRYGTSRPLAAPRMSNNDRDVYERALETWVPEHPFLGGGTGSSPSAVFDAAITSHALANAKAADAAVQREFRRRANPFLSVFYPHPRTSVYGSESVYLPPDHIGIVYDSVRARLALSEAACLLVAEDGFTSDIEEPVHMRVEISIVRTDEERHERPLLTFNSKATAPICLGPHLADIDIYLPRGHVRMGVGTEVTLVAPIHIECEYLELDADKMIVEASPRETFADAVMLTGQDSDVSIARSPLVRRNVHLCVSWPGSKVYPWRQYAVDVDRGDEQQFVHERRVREGLQRLRRFVTAFRARGKRKLARIKDKIESPRMLKGVGQKILNAMIEEGIVHMEGKMYVLDASTLGSVAGVNYVECARQRFGDQAIEFVDRATREAD